jgi:hypothetical protein
MDAPDSSPQPPILLFDDDDWLEVYGSVDRMLEQLEYPSIDEVRLVVDGNGRRLGLGVSGEDVVVEGTTDAGLSELIEYTQRFFADWTDDEPPGSTDDAASYVAAVATMYPSLRTRSKKRS